MNYLIDFYKKLDTINLIIFWGIIIVILLLLIFSIIITNKNKKLKNMLKDKQIKTELEKIDNEEIPIISEDKLNQTIINNKTVINPEKDITKEEEKKFIVEEHIIEYNKDLFNLPNIKKNMEKESNKINIPNAPYQKNILKEISSSQTSPIGIIKQTEKQNKEIIKAEELQYSLTDEPNITTINTDKTVKIEETKKNKDYIHNKKEDLVNNLPKDNKIQKDDTNKDSYLKEVSEKLSKATEKNNITRTEYELKQEEEAIISYEELMKKKDSIQIIDEEEAIISIEELMTKNKQPEKLYNLTEEEANDNFINELKKLRKDL